MKTMTRTLLMLAALMLCGCSGDNNEVMAVFAAGVLTACNSNKQTTDNDMKQELNLVQEWDKTFPKSDKVDHKKVTFTNLFGITLAADMYTPKGATGKLPAIAVCGPFGAVKEQSSGLYAQTMAERGFVTLAFDPSFTGESGGEPRRIASPDVNTEDYSAAVDFLSNCELVDPDRIGICGICGWGGFALNVAAVDPRIKATVASTMYELTRVNEKGYFDQNDSEDARYQMRQMVARQRTEDFRTGEHPRAGGVVDPLPGDAPQFVKDYYDYYKTPRGYHERSGNSTDGWATGGMMPMMNTRLLHYASEIRSAVLIIHGEKAHSRYMGEDAFKLLKGDNKELLIIPRASHCDLYDGGYTELVGKAAIEREKSEPASTSEREQARPKVKGEPKNMIPWDKLEEFFKTNLK